jgi:hypothetical protein
MSEVETKVIKTKILGKDGPVSTFYLQRHMPKKPILIIKLETDHFMACQEDHPVIIHRNKEELIVEAHEIKEGDKLYLNNENIFNFNRVYIDEKTEDIIEYIKLKTNNNIVYGNEYNYQLCPDFINFDNDWLYEFIEKLVDNELNKNILSFNLVSQIKMICDKLIIPCELILEDDEKCSFSLKIDLDNQLEKNIYNGLINVKKIYKCKKWNNYVYDIKTETKEFLLNCIQTHNSFHTGGAVEVIKVDIVNELKRNFSKEYEHLINEKCKQENYDLITKADFTTIRIDKEIFKNQFKIEKKDNFYFLPAGFFILTLDDLEINATIDKYVNVYKNNAIIEETAEAIILTYNKEDKLIKIDPYTPDPTRIAKRIDELFGGRSPWTTPESLFMKCYDTFSSLGNWDTVHLEVILSNILRWKKDPQIAARLKTPYDATTYSIKALPGIMSWPLGVSFENFSAGMTRGLISDRAPESSIEKVLFGDFLLENEKDKN